MSKHEDASLRVNSPGPSTQFSRSVAANVAYWHSMAQLPAEQKIRALDGERHNLFRAAEFGLALADTWSQATDLILDCYELILYRGYCQEWIPVLERVLEDCPENKPGIRITLYHQLGNLYRLERRFEMAIEKHGREEQLAIALKDDFYIARANSNQCKTYYLLRQHDDAERRALAALAYYQGRDETKESYAAMLNLLGLIAQSRGDLTVSESWYRQAIEVFRKTELTIELVRVLRNLAIVLESEGKVEQSLDTYHEVQTLLEPTNYEIEKSNVALSLGTLYFHRGDLVKAEACYRQAYSPYFQDFGPIYDQAMVTNNLGNVYHAQGRFAEAEIWLGKSISSFRQAKAQLMLANALATLARTFADQGKVGCIEPLFNEAMTLVKQYPDDAFAGSIKKELAQVNNYLLD
jgi:tetratricopeptide (TPR) repeat protein